MLQIGKDDIEPKQKATHRASEVGTLAEQQHSRNYGHIFEIWSSGWHWYSLNTFERCEKRVFRIFLSEQAECPVFHLLMAFPKGKVY